MKHIYNLYSVNQFRQSSRFLLPTFFLITFISFSGTNSVVSAQTTAEVFRETDQKEAVSKNIKTISSKGFLN